MLSLALRSLQAISAPPLRGPWLPISVSIISTPRQHAQFLFPTSICLSVLLVPPRPKSLIPLHSPHRRKSSLSNRAPSSILPINTKHNFWARPLFTRSVPQKWLLLWTTLRDNLCQTHPKSSLGFTAFILVTTFNKPFSSPGGGT